jgi:hypothetical protein
MAIKIFLGVSVAIWLPYGLFCFFQPAFLEQAAGLTLGSAVAATEVRAMYGGLQVGIGCLALAGLWRNDLARSALLALAFLTGGLVIARIMGALMAGDGSSYTVQAIVFEATSVVCASWLYRSVVPTSRTGATTA